MSAKKFFADNISRISPQADPLGWNLNNGLFVLAEQQEQLQATLIAMNRQLQAIERELQQLKSR